MEWYLSKEIRIQAVGSAIKSHDCSSKGFPRRVTGSNRWLVCFRAVVFFGAGYFRKWWYFKLDQSQGLSNSILTQWFQYYRFLRSCIKRPSNSIELRSCGLCLLAGHANQASRVIKERYGKWTKGARTNKQRLTPANIYFKNTTGRNIHECSK